MYKFNRSPFARTTESQWKFFLACEQGKPGESGVSWLPG